jgi:hypothetical protein
MWRAPTPTAASKSYALRNCNRAVADFSAAVGLDPYHPIAHGNRGNVKHVLTQLDAAIADYSRRSGSTAVMAGA